MKGSNGLSLTRSFLASEIVTNIGASLNLASGFDAADGRKKTPAISRGFSMQVRYVSGFYRLAVLSRNGRLTAVVDVTVMSPLAPTVYTLPAEKDTNVLVTAFVAEPATRVARL